MQSIEALVAAIAPLDAEKMAQAAQHIDGLVKPLNSLGRLEALAIQLAGMRGLPPLGDLAKEIIVMCADHGVYQEGVALAPQAVTRLQAQNMLNGSSGVCVLAKSNQTTVLPVDVGINGDPLDGMLSLKVARGSDNIAVGPAMRHEQAEQILLASAELVKQRAAAGIAVLGTGELGMANTTPASAMISVLCGCDPHEVVGHGANLPPERLQHKEAIVRQAIRVNQPNPADALDVLAKVGGYDLVGMTGVILGAGACGLPVVLDGFLSYASAIAACQIAPAVKHYCIPSHFSAEKGSQRALEHLGLQPYLWLDLRLGEGSGAALGMSIVSAACAMYSQMGVLAHSGIDLKA